MAVVINGNGTVTGIAVGGLPDGIVDAGTLATNSVDSAELIDGAVDNSHLSDDAVAVAELAATGTASSTTFLRGDNSWQAAGGGAWELISSTVPTVVVNISFILDPTKYTCYKWMLSNIKPTTNSNRLAVRTSTDGGSTYTTGSGEYQYSAGSLSSQASLDQNGNQNANMGVMNNQQVGSSYGQNYEVMIWGPHSTNSKPHFHYLHAGENSSGNNLTSWGSAHRSTSLDVDAVQFLWETLGTFQAVGKIHFLGLKI